MLLRLTCARKVRVSTQDAIAEKANALKCIVCAFLQEKCVIKYNLSLCSPVYAIAATIKPITCLDHKL